MSNIKNNNIFEKTSFLGGNNSEFIEELYAQYIVNPNAVSNEWKEFFKGLKDNKKEIIQKVNGPSWSPKKKKAINNFKEFNNKSSKGENTFEDTTLTQISAKDSIRANTLMRAYRIRGHLISNLDP